LKLYNSSVFDELTGRRVTLIAYPGTGKTAMAKEAVSTIYVGRL
jgi:superfamily II DNA or RNA helicase